MVCSPLSGEFAGHEIGLDERLLLPVVKDRPRSLFKIFLRSTQLDTFWNGLSRLRGHGPQVEERKQAVHGGITTVLVMLVAVHLVPILGVTVLLWLNLGGYYVGGEMQGGGDADANDTKLSTLQFVAKLHEVLMQASLSVVVIALIRHELLEGRAIPFGAIFGSLQFSNATYIFSKEYAGLWRATMQSRMAKAKLILLLFVGALLAITVGPSSAITMRPRLDSWEAGGTDIFLNTTLEEMWPSRMTAFGIPDSCRVIDTNSTCISQDWLDVGSQLLSFFPSISGTRDTTPEVFRLGDSQSVREIGTRTTARTLYPFDQALSTVPMSTLANALYRNGQLWAIAAANFRGCSKRFRRFMWRQDVKYSIKNVKQPATAVVCYNYTRSFLSREDIAQNLERNMMLFPTGKSMCEDIDTRQDPTYNLTDWQEIQAEPLRMIMDFIKGSSLAPDLRFVELQRDVFGRTSIGAVASIPSNWQRSNARLYSCVIRSRWLDADIQSTRNNLKMVTGSLHGGWPDNEKTGCSGSDNVIELTPEWASYLNPIIQSTQKSVYHSLVEFAGKPPSTTWGRGPLYFGSVTESILSNMITAGLSHTQGSAKIQGSLNYDRSSTCPNSCKSWCLDMMPDDKREFGYGRNIYNLSTFDVANTTKFTMRVDIDGYAYNIRGPSMILSCMVLLGYCAMVIIHVIFAIWKRSSSTAWDSVSEVVALAMQSKPSDKLVNTCAGINSTGVFSNNVRILKTGPNRDHLELDFCDDMAQAGTGEKIVEKEFFT